MASASASGVASSLSDQWSNAAFFWTKAQTVARSSRVASRTVSIDDLRASGNARFSPDKKHDAIPAVKDLPFESRRSDAGRAWDEANRAFTAPARRARSGPAPR